MEWVLPECVPQRAQAGKVIGKHDSLEDDVKSSWARCSHGLAVIEPGLNGWE